jgi:hypothetical protein
MDSLFPLQTLKIHIFLYSVLFFPGRSKGSGPKSLDSGYLHVSVAASAPAPTSLPPVAVEPNSLPGTTEKTRKD